MRLLMSRCWPQRWSVLFGLYYLLAFSAQSDVWEIAVLLLLHSLGITTSRGRRCSVVICFRVGALLLDPQTLPSEAEAMELARTAVVHYSIALGCRLVAQHIQRLLGRLLRLRWALMGSEHGALRE